MKYEFAGEEKSFLGITLKRIRAIRDIEKYGVKAGDVGGWIEKEENLSQSGNAWVYGDAQVYGDAWVYGNAQVCGNARVSGNAQVYGNAWVYGNAQVCCNARVYGNAQVCCNARVCDYAQVCGDAWECSPLYIQGRIYSFSMCAKNKIKIGCQIHSFSAWERNWKRIAKENNFPKESWKEYALYFNLACDLYGKEKYKIDLKEVECADDER